MARDNRDKQERKRTVSASAVARIVIWSVVLCILTGILAWGLAVDGGGAFTVVYRYDEADFTVGNGTTAEKVTKISIDWMAGDVTVLPSDGDEIVITEDYDGESEKLRLRWRVEDGELTVKYCKSGRIASGKSASKKLTVAIPAAMLETMGEVEITSADCDVSYNGNADELDLDAVNGSLTVTGDVGELNVDGVRTQMTFTGAVRRADVDCVDTDVTMHLDMAKELNFDQVKGSICLRLSEEITGFQAEIDALSGNVYVNGYEGVESRGSKSARWGDKGLRIAADGIDVQLEIEKLTED